MSPDEPSDADLIARFLDGDEPAFDALYLRYAGCVYRFCFAMSRNAEDARDLCQESFLRIYRGLPSFEGRSSFETWARKIVGNTCLRAIERRAPIATDDEDAPASVEQQPDRIAERLETNLLLHRTLNALPWKYRTILVLRDVEGLPYEEIREALELSLSQVKSRLHTARRLAREQYEKLSK